MQSLIKQKGFTNSRGKNWFLQREFINPTIKSVISKIYIIVSFNLRSKIATQRLGS